MTRWSSQDPIYKDLVQTQDGVFLEDTRHPSTPRMVLKGVDVYSANGTLREDLVHVGGEIQRKATSITVWRKT